MKEMQTKPNWNDWKELRSLFGWLVYFLPRCACYHGYRILACKCTHQPSNSSLSTIRNLPSNQWEITWKLTTTTPPIYKEKQSGVPLISTLVIETVLIIYFILGIGGSRGRARCMPPLRIQILSFRHTKFSKCNRLRSPRPLRGPPPYGKSWIRHC